MGKTFNFISGALFGAAAGAIIGVALAPRSGAETRAMAADIANDAWDNMRDILNADALDLIEETVKAGAKAAGARKWWLGELSREANAKGVSLEELPITPADVAEVEKLIASGKLNDKLAKQTVEGVLKGEGTPDEVVKKHDYKIVEDNGAIEAAVDAAFEANPDVVEKLKSGNMKPMGVIIGAVMKATRGQADAKAVTKVVMGKIKG